MQWWVLAGWGAATVLCRKRRGLRWALCAGLAASMAGQLLLLQLDGRLTLETAAPLHLCALSGLLCLPMLLSRSQALYSWMCFLGAPCALLALLFPAVAHSSRQLLMNLAFFSLHALILCAALWRAMKEPLPTDPRGVMVAANAWLVAVSAFNRFAGTNYLFLRSAPAGTPLQALAARGSGPYILALELLALLLLSALSALYEALNAQLLRK